MSCSVIGHPDKERNRVSQWIVEDLSATRSSSRPNLNVAGRRFIDWGSSTCPTLPRSARLYSSPARPRHYWPTTTRTTFARWGLSSKRTFELGESRFQKRRFSSFVHRRLTALGRFLTRFEEFLPRSLSFSRRIFEGMFVEGNGTESLALWRKRKRGRGRVSGRKSRSGNRFRKNSTRGKSYYESIREIRLKKSSNFCCFPLILWFYDLWNHDLM